MEEKKNNVGTKAHSHRAWTRTKAGANNRVPQQAVRSAVSMKRITVLFLWQRSLAETGHARSVSHLKNSPTSRKAKQKKKKMKK